MTTPTNDFFSNAPDNYEVPKGESQYMKFEQGDNKFRILEKPIFGWEAWTIPDAENPSGKPVRFPMDQKPRDLRLYKNQRANHFWAMPVWNFRTSRVEVLQVTQKTIQQAVENLARSEDWGSPLHYSITVNKEGTTKEDTKYHVAPSPHKEVPEEVKNAWEKVKANGFDLTELYRGGDPFQPSEYVEAEKQASEQFEATYDDLEHVQLTEAENNGTA